MAQTSVDEECQALPDSAFGSWHGAAAHRPALRSTCVGKFLEPAQSFDHFEVTERDGRDLGPLELTISFKQIASGCRLFVVIARDRAPASMVTGR
jgi:hypothetical protein